MCRVTVYTEQITDTSAWSGADLSADRSWQYEIGDVGRAELDDALEAVERRGLKLSQITRSDFELPSLAATLDAIGVQVRNGRGFALLRGVPVERYDLPGLEKIYWGLCTHLGTGMT